LSFTRLFRLFQLFVVGYRIPFLPPSACFVFLSFCHRLFDFFPLFTIFYFIAST
jgi:hypothetical protein